MSYLYGQEPDILTDDLNNGGQKGKTIVDVVNGKTTTTTNTDPPESSSTDEIIIYRANKADNEARPTHFQISDGSPREFVVYANTNEELLKYLKTSGIKNAENNTITIVTEKSKVEEKISQASKYTPIILTEKIEAIDLPEAQQNSGVSKFQNASGSKIYKYSISESNKHEWNNTGVTIEKQDGSPMDSREAYTFIQQEINAGNSAFKNLFPRMQVDDVGKVPRFTIPNDKHHKKYKYYNYHFDPNWMANFEEVENFEGKKVNTPGKVYQRLRVYEKPSTNSEVIQGNFFNLFTLPRFLQAHEHVTIIAHGNEEHNDWVKIRTADGVEGWIGEIYINTGKLPLLKDQFTKHHIKIQSGDYLIKYLNRTYKYKDIGFDNHDYAMAVNILNSGNGAIYHDGSDVSLYEIFVLAGKDVVDGERTNVRVNLRTIKLKEGKTLRLPTDEYVRQLRESGAIGTRSDFKNSLIYGMRATKGLFTGVQDGFITAGTDAVTGLWEMIKGLFSGQLFADLKQMYEAFMKMTWTELKDTLLQVFGDLIRDFLDQLDTQNVEDKYYAIGRLVGAIVFEIVVAVVTGGSGNVISALEKFDKLKKFTGFVRRVETGLSKVKSKAKDLLPDTIKNRLEAPDSIRKTNKPSGNPENIKRMDKDINDALPDDFEKKIDDFKNTHKEDFELNEKLDKEIKDPNKTDNPDSIVDPDKVKAYALATMIINYGDQNGLHPSSILPLLQKLAKKTPKVKGFSYRLTPGTNKAKFFLHGSLFAMYPGDGVYDYALGLGEMADLHRLDDAIGDLSKVDFEDLDIFDKESFAINKSDFKKLNFLKGLIFERRVTKIAKKGLKPPFDKWIKEGYTHQGQLHLKKEGGKKIIGDDVFIKEIKVDGVKYNKAIFHDSKLKGDSPWTDNQKSELIDIFENTDEPYIEFEVRSSDIKLKDNNSINTGEKIRIYREDVYKTTSDNDLNIDNTFQIF